MSPQFAGIESGMSMQWLDRIEELAGERGFSSLEALAQKADLDRSYFRKARERNSQGPKNDTLLAIAGALGIDADALRRELTPQFISSFDPDLPDNVTDLGRYKSKDGPNHQMTPGAIVEIDVRAGAGGGGYVTEGNSSDGVNTYSADAVRAEWILPPSFVRDELRLTFGRTEIIAIRGDSMEPDLRDGDRVLIDRTDTNLRQGGIFAVSDAGEIIVKQVELVRDSDPLQIICTSRNDRYRPVTLTLDDGTFIIGRVAARISRM